MKLVIGIVVILAVALAIFAWQAKKEPVSGIPEGVACTMDAMQCPDGSYVGRSGPNCEFVCPGN